MSQETSDSAQLPSSSEKLPHKFILDALHKKAVVAEESEPEIELEARTEPQTEVAQPLPTEKRYFRIGEASTYIGVEPYVLRYWEREFHAIRPMKSKTGHRVYSRKDMDLFRRVYHLLYVEKFSVKGAKKQLREKKHVQPVPTVTTETAPANNKALKELAKEIKDLIQVIRTKPPSLEF